MLTALKSPSLILFCLFDVDVYPTAGLSQQSNGVDVDAMAGVGRYLDNPSDQNNLVNCYLNFLTIVSGRL